MDDEKEFEELLKAEAEEKRDTKLVIEALKVIGVLLVLGIAASFTSQILYFIQAR